MFFCARGFWGLSGEVCRWYRGGLEVWEFGYLVVWIGGSLIVGLDVEFFEGCQFLL